MEPVNCFVAMFDIIGFKNLRQTIGTSGLHQRFVRGVLPSIHHSAAGRGKHINRDGVNLYVPDFNEFSVKFQNISDTVIFYTPDDSFRSFLSVVHCSFMLVQHGFAGGKNPFRGAIGWGDLVAENSILIGSAIEDAYEGESKQVWAGAMITPTCKEFLDSRSYLLQYQRELNLSADAETNERKRSGTRNAARRLVLYDVPIQHNPKNALVRYSQFRTYVLDWTINMYEGAAEASFDPSHDQHAQQIAMNTIAFEKWAREQRDSQP